VSEKTEKKHLFDDPRNVDRLLKGFYVICIVLVIVDFVVHRHTEMAWEEIPAFYAIYGFVACVVLVLLAKLMRKVVMRKEDYYDD
jgi:Na+/glutamate symporter